MKKNLAVFISGEGTNLNIFLQNKEKFAQILVVSSKKDAYGLTRALNHQVPTLVLDSKIDWTGLNQKLQDKKIDLIFLAGFMRIIPEEFVKNWQNRIYNLHPSMLPKYKGLKAIDQAIKAHDEIGVTIHRVIPELDSGEIVLQKRALKQKEVASLTKEQILVKTQQTEHELVAQWIEWILTEP